MTKLIMAVLFFLIPLSLTAAGFDVLRYGNGLLSVCDNAIVDDYRTLSDADRADALLCYGYTSGFNDGHRMMALWSALKSDRPKNNALSKIETEPRYCHPENLDKKQFVSVIVRYLMQHRENLHEESYLLIGNAMEDAFPCNW